MGKIDRVGQEYVTSSITAKVIDTDWKQVNDWMFWKHENPKSGK